MKLEELKHKIKIKIEKSINIIHKYNNINKYKINLDNKYEIKELKDNQILKLMTQYIKINSSIIFKIIKIINYQQKITNYQHKIGTIIYNNNSKSKKDVHNKTNLK